MLIETFSGSPTYINKEDNYRLHIIKDLINVDELIEKLEKFYKSSNYDPKMNSLWDLRDADFSSVTSKQVHSAMEMVKKNWSQEGTVRAALLVSKDLDYGLSRMYAILMDGATSGKVMVFRNYDEAVKWIKE